MSDLSPEARDFLEELRSADDPSPDERRLVRTALVASVTAGAGVLASGAAKASPYALSLVKGSVALSFLGGVALGLAVVGPPTLYWAAGSAKMMPRSPPAVTPGPRATPAAITPARKDVAEAPRPVPSARPHTNSSPARVSNAPGERPREVLTPGTLDQELALVRSAQEALQAGRPAEALLHLDEHARRFPHGALTEERAGARALAVCTLRREDGPALARSFLLSHPSSPFAARIRALCIP